MLGPGRVTLVEPGPFGTDWAGASAVDATPQPQYDALRAASAESSRSPQRAWW